MHPALQHDLMQARQRDLLRSAAQQRLAAQARQRDLLRSAAQQRLAAQARAARLPRRGRKAAAPRWRLPRLAWRLLPS
jgi:hypothetical protein